MTVSRGGYSEVPADAATLVILATSVVGASRSRSSRARRPTSRSVPVLEPWPFLLLAGIAAAGVSSLLFLTAIRTIGGTRTGILMLFEPVVGVALAAAWLGEALVPLQVAGGGLVLAGAAMLQFGSGPGASRSRKRTPAPWSDSRPEPVACPARPAARRPSRLP